MNWSEAIQAMAEGKKVRATNWLEGAYISATGQDEIGTGEDFNVFLSESWELYEEPASYEDAVKAIMDEAFENIKALKKEGGA